LWRRGLGERRLSSRGEVREEEVSISNAVQGAGTLNPRILFIIDSDPRSSARPAEAIRIAAGISVWKKVTVSVYLRQSAALILAEDLNDLRGQENYERYLPLLADSGCPIFVQSGATSLSGLGKSAVPFQEISDAELAELAAENSQVLRF
jgi:hypothetical protein